MIKTFIFAIVGLITLISSASYIAATQGTIDIKTGILMCLMGCAAVIFGGLFVWRMNASETKDEELEELVLQLKNKVASLKKNQKDSTESTEKKGEELHMEKHINSI